MIIQGVGSHPHSAERNRNLNPGDFVQGGCAGVTIYPRIGCYSLYYPYRWLEFLYNIAVVQFELVFLRNQRHAAYHRFQELLSRLT